MNFVYLQATGWLRNISTSYEDICFLETIGKTYEGRDIFVLTVIKATIFFSSIVDECQNQVWSSKSDSCLHPQCELPAKDEVFFLEIMKLKSYSNMSKITLNWSIVNKCSLFLKVWSNNWKLIAGLRSSINEADWRHSPFFYLLFCWFSPIYANALQESLNLPNKTESVKKCNRFNSRKWNYFKKLVMISMKKAIQGVVHPHSLKKVNGGNQPNAFTFALNNFKIETIGVFLSLPVSVVAFQAAFLPILFILLAIANIVVSCLYRIILFKWPNQFSDCESFVDVIQSTRDMDRCWHTRPRVDFSVYRHLHH